MSSESLEIETKSRGLIFTWTIHNFRHCAVKEKEFFRSPEFMVESFGDVFWHLSIVPKVYEYGFFNCFLVKNKECSTCVYTLSVLKNDGTIELIQNETSHDTMPSHVAFSYKTIPFNDKKYYFDKDSLTLQCQMWKKDEPDKPMMHCRAHTEVKVSTINYTWTIDDIVENCLDLTYQFNHSTEVPVRMSSAMSTMKIYTTNGGSSGEDAIHFGVQIPDLKEDVLLGCGIHFLDARKRMMDFVWEERLLEAPRRSEAWYFRLISKDQLYSDKTLYLDNDQLVLRCEFYFSGRDVVHKIDYARTPEELQNETARGSMSGGREIWSRSMGAFYSEGRLSNVVLRTPTREFPAHREFLSAHSEVFRAMFEHDTRERSSGVVEIGDVENDIVDKMLRFVYTGTVEGMDHSIARKLYYAADKYGIGSLLEICSDALANDIDASKVFHVLIHADRHHDEVLKSRMKDFVSANVHDVVNSQYWKDFQETHSQLAFEMMDWLIRRKFPKQ